MIVLTVHPLLRRDGRAREEAEERGAEVLRLLPVEHLLEETGHMVIGRRMEAHVRDIEELRDIAIRMTGRPRAPVRRVLRRAKRS